MGGRLVPDVVHRHPPSYGSLKVPICQRRESKFIAVVLEVLCRSRSRSRREAAAPVNPVPGAKRWTADGQSANDTNVSFEVSLFYKLGATGRTSIVWHVLEQKRRTRDEGFCFLSLRLDDWQEIKWPSVAKNCRNWVQIIVHPPSASVRNPLKRPFLATGLWHGEVARVFHPTIRVETNSWKYPRNWFVIKRIVCRTSFAVPLLQTNRNFQDVTKLCVLDSPRGLWSIHCQHCITHSPRFLCKNYAFVFRCARLSTDKDNAAPDTERGVNNGNGDVGKHPPRAMSLSQEGTNAGCAKYDDTITGRQSCGNSSSSHYCKCLPPSHAPPPRHSSPPLPCVCERSLAYITRSRVWPCVLNANAGFLES